MDIKELLLSVENPFQEMGVKVVNIYYLGLSSVFTKLSTPKGVKWSWIIFEHKKRKTLVYLLVNLFIHCYDI